MSPQCTERKYRDDIYSVICCTIFVACLLHGTLKEIVVITCRILKLWYDLTIFRVYILLLDYRMKSIYAYETSL